MKYDMVVPLQNKKQKGIPKSDKDLLWKGKCRRPSERRTTFERCLFNNAARFLHTRPSFLPHSCKRILILQPDLRRRDFRSPPLRRRYLNDRTESKGFDRQFVESSRQGASFGGLSAFHRLHR
uniref:Uncharacterized protein n=1 Tax=Corethron hystrix TaxID=216773 RepID=A0A7S1FP26_9STRA